MALEVRELIIRAAIVRDGQGGESLLPQSDESANNAVTPQEEIITACIEKILEILKDKHGR